MHNHPESNHNRAAITLYYVVSLNTEKKFRHTITRAEAAKVLASLLQINHRTPESWMRGDFRKHPVSRENFLRFVRAYRTKPGLENVKEISALAIDLYGVDYRKAIELLDPADRENDLAEEVLIKLPGTSDVVMMINNLLEFSSREVIETAFKTLINYQWFVISHSGLEQVH